MKRKLLEAIEIYNELNPKLFENDVLREDVRKRILKSSRRICELY